MQACLNGFLANSCGARGDDGTNSEVPDDADAGAGPHTTLPTADQHADACLHLLGCGTNRGRS